MLLIQLMATIRSQSLIRSTSNKNVSFTNGLRGGSSNTMKHVCLNFWIG